MTRRSLLMTMAATPLVAAAQQKPQRVSPHETASLDVNGKKIEIVYGRPSLKGRKAFEGDLAPTDQVWRLGADEATKLILSSPALLNDSLKLAAGSYSLFAIPGSSKWTIIVNKTADQWGAFKYDSGQDAGRFTAPVKKPDGTVEEFTIQITKGAAKTVNVSMAWQDASVTFPVTFA